jgi:putative ATPase
MADPAKGVGQEPPEMSDALRDRIAQAADGDARRALGALEIAVNLARSAKTAVDEAIVDEALQRRALRYDKGGDEHYDVISAFIKSMRGSDPDAAVYWMTRMLEAGEDPLFVLRRMVIFASEDVGNADPRALLVAMDATEAFRFVGMPEGVLPMTQAAIYLATAPKSNTVLKTYGAAREAVMQGGTLPVPTKLRNAPTKLMKEMGFGQGYQYPHDFEGGHVEETYLPERARGQRVLRADTVGVRARHRRAIGLLAQEERRRQEVTRRAGARYWTVSQACLCWRRSTRNSSGIIVRM